MIKPSSHACGPNSQPSSPDIAAIAAMLNEAAQALLELGSTRQVAAQDAAGAGNPPPESAPKPAPEQAASAYEVRAYRIPRYILRDERKLLEMTGADELLDVLHKAYGHLHCLTILMKQYNPGENLCGFEVNDIADALSLPLRWLGSLISTFSGFELVHQVKAE